MAKDSSFDVVSSVNMQEMDNAVNQANKEISQRYDFKGSIASIAVVNDSLRLDAEDQFRLNAMMEVLRGKMIKRGISAKCLGEGKIEKSLGGNIKQEIEIQKGISKEKAKEIVAAIKTLKLKVQAQILEDQVRVSGAKKDELQEVMQLLKSKDFGLDIQFINPR